MLSTSTLNSESFATYLEELEALYAAGARRFVLFTVPRKFLLVSPYPIYCETNANYRATAFNQSPYFMTVPYDVLAVLAATDINAWNQELNSTAAAFQSAYPDAQVQILETNPIFQQILANPTEYGAPDNSCYNSDGVSCLWWVSTDLFFNNSICLMFRAN